MAIIKFLETKKLNDLTGKTGRGELKATEFCYV